MAEKNEITADDLEKLALSLALVGYALGMLAIEKGEKEAEESRGNGKKKVTAVINKMYRRFHG